MTASGGARMQEGILSLMQLPKTVCAVDELREARCAFISVMTHPTTAGVLASFASLGDVIVAEPGALLAFTGPRVVQQTTREKLPDDFGLAESNARFGHVDAIVPRAELRPYLGRLLALFVACAVTRRAPASQVEQLKLTERLAKLRELPLLAASASPARWRGSSARSSASATSRASDEVWHAVELARHQDRPYTLDYVERICDDFVELHGDRSLGDDPAIVAGLGRFDGRTVALVGHQKGRDIRERTHRNFGMTYPEGYRKAMRAMELADRHRLPVSSRSSTRPAPTRASSAEQHGQGGWIARCQLAMVRLGVPTVTCVIGEGGSGGAVAIAVADRVLMQENAIYSVISPEGCAAILWRDAGEAKKAAAAFKPDARHCLELGVIDGIVPEPAGRRAHRPRRGRAARSATSLEGSLARASTQPIRRAATPAAWTVPRAWASSSTRGRDSAIHSVHRVFPVALRSVHENEAGKAPASEPTPRDRQG